MPYYNFTPKRFLSVTEVKYKKITIENLKNDLNLVF